MPFALLGTVQLLAVAAWVALAGTALALRRRAAAAALIVLGALALAGADMATAVAFGTPSADAIALVRAAGGLLLAAGLLRGGLGGTPAEPPGVLASVVVPLAARPGPAALAAVALGLAAGAGWWRAGRELGTRLIAAGLAVTAAAAAVSGAAGSSAALSSLTVGLRGIGAGLVLAGLIRLARRSLLGKVVAATLAGVLAMAAAAVGVVGTVVVQSYDDQAQQLVREAAADRLAAVNRVIDAARVFVPIAATACTRGTCQAAREQFTSGDTTDDFVVQVNRVGQSVSLGGLTPLSPAERLGLTRDASVRAVFAGSAQPDAQAERINEVATAIVRLVGSPPGLAVIAIKLDRPLAPTSAVIYGVRLDDAYAANDVAAGVYGLSFLIGGQVVASNLPAGERARVQQIADRQDVTAGLGPDAGRGLTVAAEGSEPTVHFAYVNAPDGTALGVIALSRDAELALAAQRRALTYLLATALLATALVGVLALLVGRRTVDPVRRLTLAAERVSAGDLGASADVRSVDEVGTLSRTFDAMTGSLAQLTGDLRSAATRLQTVLTSMSDGLVATDAEGLVTSINPAALRLIGLSSPEQALGRPLAEVVDVRDAAGAAMLATGDRLLDAPGELYRGPDDTVAVRVAVADLDGEAGLEGVVLVLRDTSREREIERMKTEFLSNVSHELRTPLTPIRGYAEILVAKPGMDAGKVATFATTIRDESIKMNRVVDLLVDVAAIEAGRVTITPRPVNVKDLLDARVLAWKERAPTRATDVKRRVAGGLPPVWVDPTWVSKALDELIDNAVKYTPRGTSITLVASLHDDAVRVGVKDAGPGIAEADQRLLFTSFEQVDGSATRRVGGLGLGLSFVRRLAEDAGFPLSFSSVVGKGSEFSLDLPVSDEPVPKAPRRASRAARPRVPARGRAR